MTAFVPLREADAACGSKAAVLGELLRAGFAVPDGFVLSVDAGAGWEQEVHGVLDALGGSSFAVRSSGAVEDGHESSFAGQFHTSLNVPTAEVETEVRKTAASVEHASICVRHRPAVTGRRGIVIEAVHGLGDRLVSGQADPGRWSITPGCDPRCLTARAVLTTEQVTAVAQAAMSAEQLLGGPQDVEWVIADGQVWVLQARPITGAPTTARAAADAPSTVMTPAVSLASGTPASPGTARGCLRIIEGLDDFSRFAPAEVLVCGATSPAWTPLLARAAAVVATRGGVLSHAAIIARELRIPPSPTSPPPRACRMAGSSRSTARVEVEAVMTEFESLNHQVTNACTRWQLAELGVGEQTISLAETVEELARAGEAWTALEKHLMLHLPRFDGYYNRFNAALDGARTDPSWVTATDRESAHRIWFELHENLLATLGRSR